jgi:ribonuclease HI
MLSDMTPNIKFTLEHVPRERNKRADKLAGQGIRMKTTVAEIVPQ